MKAILVSVLLLISILMAAFFAYSLVYRKKTLCAISLSHVLFTLAIYSGGYAFELCSTTLDGMLFWNCFEYAGVAFLPAFWILFTGKYVNARWISSRRVEAILFAISLSTFVAACTDPVFHLRYSTAFVRHDGPFPILGFTRGLFYWTHTAYSFASMTIGSVLLFRSLFSTMPVFFRRQQLLMLAGACLPWINYTFYLLGFTVWGIDTIPLSLFVSAVFFGTAIFGYRILDVVPVARGIVFETMSDGALVLDTAGRIIDFNKAASAVFPELAPSALSGDCTQVLSECRSLCSIIKDGGAGEFHFTTKVTSGVRHFQCLISDIMSPGDTPIGKVVLFKDNTDSTLLLEKLQELATIDPLTRIFNRRHFIDLATRHIEYLARVHRPLSIVILDLDYFKHINDTYGHLAGDEALRAIAKSLLAGIRSCDLIARLGGDEFICLLSETSGTAAFEAVERIRESICCQPISISGSPEITLSASFGMYCVENPSGAEKIDTYIAHADAALYRAKDKGRNCTAVYSPEL